MNISEKVKDILKELSGAESIKEENNIILDLSLDSLQLITLLVEIESVFEIELNESDMNPFELNIVSDVIALVNRYIGE